MLDDELLLAKASTGVDVQVSRDATEDGRHQNRVLVHGHDTSRSSGSWVAHSEQRFGNVGAILELLIGAVVGNKVQHLHFTHVLEQVHVLLLAELLRHLAVPAEEPTLTIEPGGDGEPGLRVLEALAVFMEEVPPVAEEDDVSGQGEAAEEEVRVPREQKLMHLERGEVDVEPGLFLAEPRRHCYEHLAAEGNEERHCLDSGLHRMSVEKRLHVLMDHLLPLALVELSSGGLRGGRQVLAKGGEDGLACQRIDCLRERVWQLGLAMISWSEHTLVLDSPEDASHVVVAERGRILEERLGDAVQDHGRVVFVLSKFARVLLVDALGYLRRPTFDDH